MYDIDIKNVKKGKKSDYLFLVAGILFILIFGGIALSTFIKSISLDKTILSTRVIVSSHIDDEGSEMFSPIYYYEVGGKEYICKSDISSNINPGTSNKNVYYDSKNPSNCLTEYSKGSNYFFLIFIIFPIIVIAIAVNNMLKNNKRIKVIKELNKTGKLVKGLPYTMENTGMRVNNNVIQMPVVEYTLPTGSTITLEGDPRHDNKFRDGDGLADLVIDEANPDNYFIDFEINRLTGNLPGDFYNQNQSQTVSQANQGMIAQENQNSNYNQNIQ